MTMRSTPSIVVMGLLAWLLVDGARASAQDADYLDALSLYQSGAYEEAEPSQHQ